MLQLVYNIAQWWHHPTTYNSRELEKETDETHEIQLHEFVIENDLPAFPFLVLDKLEECFSRQETDSSHTQAQFVVVDIN